MRTPRERESSILGEKCEAHGGTGSEETPKTQPTHVPFVHSALPCDANKLRQRGCVADFELPTQLCQNGQYILNLPWKLKMKHLEMPVEDGLH